MLAIVHAGTLIVLHGIHVPVDLSTENRYRYGLGIRPFHLLLSHGQCCARRYRFFAESFLMRPWLAW